MLIFASDLDNTLIHSYKNTNMGVCVDVKNGKQMSFMSKKSYQMLQVISEKVEFLPITTRSLEQYRRLRLLKDKYPKYAITSNGGILLVDNIIDKEWYEKTKLLIADSIGELKESVRILNNDLKLSLKPRVVDGLFVFAKTNDVEITTNSLNEKLDLTKVTIKIHKDKIYILPKKLNKGIALNRMKQILYCKFVIAAGDSFFDIPMLQYSDIPIVPLCKNLGPYIENSNTKTFDTIGTKFSEDVLEFVLKYKN